MMLTDWCRLVPRTYAQVGAQEMARLSSLHCNTAAN